MANFSVRVVKDKQIKVFDKLNVGVRNSNFTKDGNPTVFNPDSSAKAAVPFKLKVKLQSNYEFGAIFYERNKETSGCPGNLNILDLSSKLLYCSPAFPGPTHRRIKPHPLCNQSNRAIFQDFSEDIPFTCPGTSAGRRIII